MTVPMLIVQGARDPFGMPPAARVARSCVVQGDHSLRGDVPVSRLPYVRGYGSACRENMPV